MSYERLFLSIAFPLYLASFLAILRLVRRGGGDPRGAAQSSSILGYGVAFATGFWQLLVVLAILDVQSVVGRWRIPAIDQPLAVFAGSALFAVGLGLAVLGAFTLRDSFRIGLPERPTALVTAGVYRYSRNPVILGLYCYVLGFFLMVPSLVVFLSVLLNGIFYHWKILTEERYLRLTHGPAYGLYCSQVARYVPAPAKAYLLWRLR
jgi:protein-S-isoprenylcysteine O-methyltransferase Ste14